VRLDECSPGIGYQLPVHGIGNDVSTPVVAPHEGGVDALDVWGQAGIGQRPPADRVPLTARQLPVVRTCYKSKSNNIYFRQLGPYQLDLRMTYELR